MINDPFRLRQDFDHVRIGNGFNHFPELRQDNVNLVVSRDAVSPGTLRYLATIDFHEHFRSDWDAALSSVVGCKQKCGACSLFRPANAAVVDIVPGGIGNLDPHQPDAIDVVRTSLRRFPQTPGIDHFAADVLQALKVFTETTNSQKVSSLFIAKYPIPGAVWHRDNDTDMRGLITFTGPGTLWRPNDTVPEADWLQDQKDERGFPMNSFGLLGRDFMAHAQQVETASMSIWKGDRHARPLIHAEPTDSVVGRKDIRLVMNMNMVS